MYTLQLMLVCILLSSAIFASNNSHAVKLLALSIGFRSITKSYYRNSVGAILVYDITKRRSFEHLEDWLEEARLHIEPHNAVYMVVGHKCDMESKRAVTLREGRAFAEFYGLKFMETSAKTGKNVEETFYSIAKDVYDMLEHGHIRVEEGWDGVKNGYAHARESFTLVEGESEGGGCCS